MTHDPEMDDPQADGSAVAIARRTLVDYRALAEFRYELRKFLAFSDAQAEAAGMLPQQYQAMVAIKGFSPDGALTMGELAERLCVKPHTAVEMADRMVALGLVERVQDTDDRRRVRVRLTEDGEVQLRSLAAAHVHLLRRIAPALVQGLRRLQAGMGGSRRGGPRSQRLSVF